MLYILLAVVFFLVILYPQFYVKKVLNQYRNHPKTFSQNGHALAQELLFQNGIHNVQVETIDGPDHYDPIAKAVRLSKENALGNDLTSLVVAAHEVGHAIQDHTRYSLLGLRTSLATLGMIVQKWGGAFMMITPILTLVTRSPRIGLLSLIVGVAGLLSNTIINFVTLPVEIDASFKRALPLLKKRPDFSELEHKGAHQILKACAYTYLASSLSDLLNVMRWIAVLRRR
ncbi:MAG: zinc metallopeptidase [Bdellovibrionota bacterium]|nr:zinc metallopeptidase [Bdellovibrionota bacterium]